MLEQSHPEYEEVDREIKDVENKLSTVYISIGDYRQHVDKTATYYKLVDEVLLNGSLRKTIYFVIPIL